MDLLLEYGESNNKPLSLRLIMLSGDWIPVSMPGRIRNFFKDVEVVSLGGATEASIWSVVYPIIEVAPDQKRIPYGKPLANQTLHVLDSRLHPRPVWVTGDLYIGGIGLAQGYWADTDKTGARFFVHPQSGERLYRTGDIARYLPDGNIEFLGREDDQVKIRGYRIELGEIEAILGSHDKVAKSVVIVRDSATEKTIVAYVVVNYDTPSEPSLTDELLEFLRLKLPDYMVPSYIVVLQQLPSGAHNFAYDLCINRISSEQKKTLDLSTWNIALNGAEPVRKDTLESFSEAFRSSGFRPKVFSPCYGLAEATLVVSGTPASSLPRSVLIDKDAYQQGRAEVARDNGNRDFEVVSCGGGFFDQEIVIVDPDKCRRALPGEVGEIWLAGPSVAKGYWGRPRETRETFGAELEPRSETRYLRTGDLGFMQEDELFIAGRLKDIIIIHGRNLYPQDIEATVAMSHPALRMAGAAAFSVDMTCPPIFGPPHS